MKASKRIEMGSRVFGRGLAGACLLTVLSAAGPARAEGNAADSERANVLFKKGKVAYNDGKYTDALRLYDEAWRLKQSPDIAANLAQTEAELGKHRDAAEHFAFALAHLLPSSTDEQKKALAEGLEIEKKEVGTLHVTLEPADAAFSIDDASVTLPTNGDVYVEPGDHRASVTREGYQLNQQTVHVSKGAAQVLWIRLLEVGALPFAAAADVLAKPDALDAPPPKLDQESSRSMVPAIVGGGLAVAGVAVGVVFLISANSSQNDANQLGDDLTAKGGANACGTGTPFGSQCATLHDDNKAIDRSRAIEVTGFVVAGAAAIGTAMYLLWPRSSVATARGLTPTFAVAPGAGTLGLVGRF
jgi:tetratricopeptide (TPR) repeat protein